MSEMSTREKLLEAVRLIKSNNLKGELYFLVKSGGVQKIKKGKLDSGTQEKLTKNFYDHLEFFFGNEDLEIMGLTEADERKNVLYHYDYEDRIKELDDIDSVQKTLIKDEFDIRAGKMSDIKGFIFAYVHKDIRVTLYKENYEVMMVKRNEGEKLKEKINIVLTDSNELKEFNDSIFRLNYNFDFIMIDGEIYVKELKKLEAKFGFTEIVKKKAKESIIEIEKLNLIKDVSQLLSEVDDITFARKIVKVATRSVVLKTCSKKDILTFLETYDEAVKSKFKYDETGKFIDLDTKVSRTAFIQLLDDSFLYSQLTKHKYLSGSKDDINK